MTSPSRTVVFWLTAFVDVAESAHDQEVTFWRAVIGYGLSPARGDHAELETLGPPEGDAHLKVQRLREGRSGIHLDLHVAALDAATARAESLGALVVERPGHVVLRSPGGFGFCLVTHPGAVRAEAASWGAHRSIVDQVCLDIPPSSYDAECSFWAALLELPVGTSSVRADFRHLVRSHGQPIRLLLQRLDDDGGPVRAHLDLATHDRAAEVARHVSLGAVPVRRTDCWTTLRDPAGLAYCVTDRDPATGTTP